MRKYILSTAIFLATVGLSQLKAQTTDALGAYTPYSLYGIGNIEQINSAINRGMGGIGAGVRDNRYINYKNIASITQRDTLAFMMDFGLYGRNVYIKDSQSKTANNSVNINNFVITAPLVGKSALIFGIMPYSSIGYKFETKEADPKLVSKYGDIAYQKYGHGGVTQLFLGGAMSPIENLSVGVEGIFYFGKSENNSDVLFNSDAAFRTIRTGWNYKANGFSAEAGAQYFTDLFDGYTVSVGATYRLKSKLNGDMERFSYAGSNYEDTTYYDKRNYRLTLPGKLTAGVSVRKGEKWMVGFDYEHQNWSKSNFRATPGVGFTAQAENAYKVGVEYIPNKYDIRYYYKRITYRAGAYFNQSYVKIDGKSVNAIGFTLGCSLPIFRWHNSLNLAVDLGQRGKASHNMVREKYVNFIVSLNLYDLWFIKPRYQ